MDENSERIPRLNTENFCSHLHDVLRQDLLGDWNFEVIIESDDDYDYITISVPKEKENNNE